MNRYRAFNLTFSSDLNLEEFLPTSDLNADVYIKKGKVNKSNLNPTNVFRGGICAACGVNDTNNITLHWSDVISFEMINGHTIVYEPYTDHLPTLQLYLMAEAMGIILYQRGLFLLHGSAILLNGKANVVVGTPGAGKSTTAAAFWSAGQTLLSDDLVAISFYDGLPYVLPSLPHFKVWEKTVDGLGIDRNLLRRSFEGSTKYLHVQDLESFPFDPIPLSKITLLKSPEYQENIKTFTPLNVHSEMVKHFPLPSSLLQGDYLKNHFSEAITLSKTVKLEIIDRPEGFENLKAFVNSRINEVISTS